MKPLVLDFESFYDSKTYTLRKMSTEEYVRDARFEALMLGVYDPTTDEEGWIPREDIQDYLDSLDPADTALICHHAHFDGLIFNHHYNFKPAYWFCTLSMANHIHGASQRVGLDALLQLYGLEGKTVPYNLFDGKRWHQLDDRIREVLGAGCVHDCKQTFKIFQRMLPELPQCELDLIDTTIRMFTEPVLEGDMTMLREICRHEINLKADAMASLGVTEKELQSAPKFISLLEQEGIEIQYKMTPKGKRAPAIAKTDEFMTELAECGDPRVEALVECRLGVKSTLNETRAGRLLRTAERGAMPVYLRYYGTHTGRCSGGDKLNWQNFPRAVMANGSSIRKSIRAPEGYKLVICDLSQIECRVLMYLAGEWEHVEAFRQGRDVYCELGSKIYGYPINKKDNPDERQFGKMCKLSCGYGTGWRKLQNSARTGASGGKPIILSDDEAKSAVNVFRSAHDRICNRKDGFWQQCNNLLPFIASGGEGDFGPFTIKDKKMYAPTGAFINYSSLVEEFDEETGKPGWFFYKKGKHRVRMYGGLMTENVTSFMATHVIKGEIINTLRHEADLRVVWETHDDFVQCVPEDIAEQVLDYTLEVCRRAPAYLPDIPLDAEGKISDRYDK